MKGKLIVVDGADGVGKQTQVKMLSARLKKEGHRVKSLHFPQYQKTLAGKLVDECLAGKRGNFIKLDPRLASLVYATDRFESKKMLQKWLDEGAIVILDRYVSANQIHQGGKIHSVTERKKFLLWLDKLEYGVFGLPRPDAIISLHLPVSISLKLLAKKTGRDQAEKNIQHQKDSEASTKWLAQTQKGWHTVVCYDKKGMLSRETIHEQVYTIVRRVAKL